MKYARLRDVRDAPDGEDVDDLITNSYLIGRKEGITDILEELSWMGENELSSYYPIYKLLWSIYDREEFE